MWCAEKGPAETALKAAEEAINTAKIEASKYVPDQAKALDSALAAVREKLNKGDYKAVLSEAPALTAKAQDMASAAAAKKDGVVQGLARDERRNAQGGGSDQKPSGYSLAE